MVWGSRTFEKLIGTPREALDVFDFEAVAHKNLPPAHFGYLAQQRISAKAAASSRLWHRTTKSSA